MVSLMSLWLPILLSAVFAFVASSMIHMLLGYHRKDWLRLPAEDAVMDAMRKLDIPPGNYMMPCPQTRQDMKNPAYLEKFKRGPIALMTVMPGGAPSMTKNLIGWFVYCLVVSLFAGYVASRAVAPGDHYGAVFRFAGCTAFIGYALALWQDSIWYSRPFGMSVRQTIDGLIYALLTGGTFGWLWPS
jgi:hypothetical protein